MKPANTSNFHENNGHGKTTVLEKESPEDSLTAPKVEEHSSQATEKQQKPTPPKRKKQIPLILAALGVGALAAGGFGYRWWQYASTHQQTDDAQVAGHIHQISSRIPGTISQVLVNDNQLVQQGQLLVKLDPKDYQSKVQQAEAALASARAQAEAAQANIGLTSETSNAQTKQAQGNVNAAVAALSTAQAALQQAKAEIPTAQAQVRSATAAVTAAKAQVAQAQANLQKAQADYNRYQTLYQEGAIPRQQLDTAKAAYDVALAQKNTATAGVQQAIAQLAQAKQEVAKAIAQLAQAQQGVASARAKLAASKGALQQATASKQDTKVKSAQYDAAKAAISQAEAALRDARLQLSYTNITAPASGRVGKKTAEVGNRVQAGTPLMAIVNDNNWIVANFKETQLENIKPKEPVEIKLDAFPNHTFKGYVDSISPASGAQFTLLPPDNATGNFTKVVQRVPVKIVFDPDSIKGYESRIVPGMSAEVSVKVK
jgi:membrane fusion protein (multidrug efflux system)